MKTRLKKDPKNKVRNEKVPSKHMNKPVEWYWDILQDVDHLLKTGGYIPLFYLDLRFSRSRYSNRIPHSSITRFYEIYYEETHKCKLFYETHCLHCQKREAICFVENSYLDVFMRYDQLKKCMK